MQILFWSSLFIVIYTFLGYGVIITLLAKFKLKSKIEKLTDLPEITFLVAAYNEEDIIEEKIQNCLQLEYPKSKVQFAFITDGSTDSTMDIIQKYSQFQIYHSIERKGKIAAVNRVMKLINTPFTVFSDANVMINQEGLKKLVQRFTSENIGAVSGEKMIMAKKCDGASSSGEGFYWKYESYLKKKDAQWNTLVGSAGEFFGIRTELYEEADQNTLIEDFIITMNLASKGYKVDYAPDALAIEAGSLNIKEETKRKVRISAGGIQAVLRLKHLLNPFKYGKLTFQYVSHRAIRWTLMPLALIAMFITNFFIVKDAAFYQFTFLCQGIFYALAVVGFIIRDRKTKFKIVYIPYYFTYMHYCVIFGWIKFIRGKQTVTWDKSKRADNLATTTNSVA